MELPGSSSVTLTRKKHNTNRIYGLVDLRANMDNLEKIICPLWGFEPPGQSLRSLVAIKYIVVVESVNDLVELCDITFSLSFI